MADRRKARRESDPALQPEPTSLAWMRTLLGYGALMALALKHNWHRTGTPFWLSIAILMVVAFIVWSYTRKCNLMDVNCCDFAQSRAVRDKFMISLAVLSLALLFSITHLRQIAMFF